MKIKVELQFIETGYYLYVNERQVGYGSHFSMISNIDILNCFIHEIEYNEKLKSELNESEINELVNNLRKIITRI